MPVVSLCELLSNVGLGEGARLTAVGSAFLCLHPECRDITSPVPLLAILVTSWLAGSNHRAESPSGQFSYWLFFLYVKVVPAVVVTCMFWNSSTTLLPASHPDREQFIAWAILNGIDLLCYETGLQQVSSHWELNWLPNLSHQGLMNNHQVTVILPILM